MPPPAPTCTHCGNAIPTDAGATEFCCLGCETVYTLIRGAGLERYYDLRGAVIPPVKTAALHHRDYAWLEAAQTEAEAQAKGPTAEATFDLLGLSCVGCVWLVERLFLRQPGAVRCEVNAELGQVRLRWRRGEADLVCLGRELQQFGYLLGPPGRRAERASGGLLVRLGICAALALNAMLFTLPSYLGMEPNFPFARLFGWLTLLFATCSVAVGGSYFIVRAIRALRLGVLHVDLPIALGIVLAYLGSLAGWAFGLPKFLYFDFVAMFTFLMLVGRWTQEALLERNRNQLLRQTVRPERVRAPDGTELPLEALRPGSIFRVPAGQAVPVAARLRGAPATFSLEWINGEPEPRAFPVGRALPAGAIPLDAAEVELEADEAWEHSLLRRLLEAGPGERRNRVLEKLLRLYLLAVLAFALTGFGLWWLGAGDVRTALQVALSVLVVSCPCALGVAVPLANELAVAHLRRRGLFVRDETLFGRLARVRRLAFDKTGTLTLEVPRLENPEALAALDAAARGALLRLVETSLHPVGRALREALLRFPAPAAPAGRLEDVPGSGVSLHTVGHRYSLGRPGWDGSATPAAPTAGADAEFRVDGALQAHFRFSEALRPEAREALETLGRGRTVVILSGDRPEKVAALCARLGLPASAGQGAMSPTDKAAWLAANDLGDTLFIGDGANDSLAFEQAACRGTPVVDRGVLEARADFHFLTRGLGVLPELFTTAARRARTLRACVAFALIYNASMIAACLHAAMNPLLAAVLMPLSSLVTIGIVLLGEGRPLRA